MNLLYYPTIGGSDMKRSMLTLAAIALTTMAISVNSYASDSPAGAKKAKTATKEDKSEAEVAQGTEQNSSGNVHAAKKSKRDSIAEGLGKEVEKEVGKKAAKEVGKGIGEEIGKDAGKKVEKKLKSLN